MNIQQLSDPTSASSRIANAMERQAEYEKEKVSALNRIATASLLDLTDDDPQSADRKRRIVDLELDLIALELKIKTLEMKKRLRELSESDRTPGV